MRGRFDDNISYFSLKTYVVTPHLYGPDETVQMRGHNICFYAELTKVIPKYHQILPLIYSSDSSHITFTCISEARMWYHSFCYVFVHVQYLL